MTSVAAIDRFSLGQLGRPMANYSQHYRGIHYSIKAAGARRWKWTVEPPESVQGLHAASGEVRGQVRDAIVAAYREIDQQADQSMH